MSKPRYSHTRQLGLDAIEVYIGDRPKREGDTVIYGEWSAAKKRITVYDGELRTELHEGLHAILGLSGWSGMLAAAFSEDTADAIEESLVRALETGLVQLGFVGGDSEK